MFAFSTATATASLALLGLAATPLALAAPTGSAPGAPLEKRDSGLSCVEFQYGGPFASFGAGGFIHLYTNITTYDPETETTSFNETRLGSYTSEDGTVEPCGDCRTTELWGFEVCQGPSFYGFNGLSNSPSEFYGHITRRDYTYDITCLTAQSTPTNGSALVLAPCEYDYENAGYSKQYWSLSVTDGVYSARLIDQTGSYYGTTYGPSASLNNGSSLTVTDQTTPFTYFGFKAPEY